MKSMCLIVVLLTGMILVNSESLRDVFDPGKHSGRNMTLAIPGRLAALNEEA